VNNRKHDIELCIRGCLCVIIQSICHHLKNSHSKSLTFVRALDLLDVTVNNMCNGSTDCCLTLSISSIFTKKTR
jgi:hypothetical protein